MLNEKVYAHAIEKALHPIWKLLNQGEEQFQYSQEKLFQLLSGEAKVFRYPQNTEGITYLGVLIQHEESAKEIQLLLKVDEQVMIIDSLFDVKSELIVDYLQVNLQFINTEGSEFSADFWQAFYKLQAEPLHEEIRERLKTWQLYIDYLILQKNIVYTIKAISKHAQNEFEISFLEEDKMVNMQFGNGDSLIEQFAFAEKEWASVISWDAAKNKLIVSSKMDLLNSENKCIKIYNKAEYDQLIKSSNEVKGILENEMIKPTINHPLLNPLYSNSSKKSYYGFSAKQEDVGLALEQLLTIAETNYENTAIIVANEQLESEVIKQYGRNLPIDHLREKDVAIQYVKMPIIEKSSVKLVEVKNKISKEELTIQNKSIEQYKEKVRKVVERIDSIELSQRKLSEYSTRNTNKINSFLNLIKSYEEEQEQLAFRNDQLIKVKEDLENSIKDQQQILNDIAEQQNADQRYYEKLEEDWLQFNQESTVYTEHIVNLKNISKSEKIIADCENKLAVIRSSIEEGQTLKAEMEEEYEVFKLNQQVEKVDQVIKKIKATADFLNTPLDLQFASSYAELTNIYMNKFMELEELEERFKMDDIKIQEELNSAQIKATKPAMTPYNYDRHYAEEKMSKVLNLIDKKPIALGINYKAKQRWKESLVEAVEDLYSMQLSMRNEKQMLENKLMAQLEYSEQLIQYFDNDIEGLKSKLAEQQQQLKLSEAEYVEIIKTAKLDIKAMKKNVQLGLTNTKGRSENYSTLEKLEKTRKAFKVELLAKYEALEVQANEIESAKKFIQILEIKHSEKVNEVIKDKEEMDVQIDVLQHDIVNSKEAIEKLKQENILINLQYEELVKQIHICQNENDIYEQKIAIIQQDIVAKEQSKQQNEKTFATMKKWQDLLQSDINSSVWKNLIDERSKLRFYENFEQYTPFVNEVVIFEDQNYSWFDVVTKLKEYPCALFITTDISQRSPAALNGFENYLYEKGVGAIERQRIIEALKVNPYHMYAEAFDKIDKPYLVQDNQKKMLM